MSGFCYCGITDTCKSDSMMPPQQQKRVTRIQKCQRWPEGSRKDDACEATHEENLLAANWRWKIEQNFAAWNWNWNFQTNYPNEGKVQWIAENRIKHRKLGSVSSLFDRSYSSSAECGPLITCTRRYNLIFSSVN